MSNVPLDAKAIFFESIEQSSPDELRAYLDRACGDNAEVRARVEELLIAHQRAGNFLGGSSPEGQTVDLPDFSQNLGTQVGPYKLLQKLGEGGMGVVYLAEQKDPISRQVALKIIKPGMDSQQVLSRFEAERQALALMEHPNIAQVFNAGTTDDGRPFFVMELVKGIPINEYCDEHNLNTEERLKLFSSVCRALQHAHQKGIVHRDVKPTNVLVAEFDNEAVPKVIDFGVAKAVSQRLTERTLFTQFGQIVGTPEYMSPEQAKLNQLDVDTRSDVYSLGVLLYELLTGDTPFDKQRLRSVAFDELLRIIREEDPPRPSVRLSTIDELPSVATKRNSEPKKLSLLLRGELDWIVMKALDKERAQRYDSASAFAEDVERYLNGDPVVACPPSRRYLLRKAAKRHKVAIGAAVALALTLFMGVVGTSWMAVRARAEQLKAMESAARAEEAQEHAVKKAGELEQVSQVLQQGKVVLQTTNERLSNRENELQKANGRLAEREKKLYELIVEIAVTAAMGGEFERTQSMIEQLEEESPELQATLTALAALYSGDAKKAQSILESVDSEKTIALRSLLAITYTHVGDPDAHFVQLETLIREPPVADTGILELLDHMLYGQAFVFYDSVEAVAHMRRVVQARPNWHLAHVALGEALVCAAGDTFDDRMKFVREALEHIDDGYAGLPGSRYALAVRLHALHAAIRYGDKSSQVDETEISEWEMQADATANALEPHSDFVFGRAYRAMYFDFIQDKERAENDWREAYDRSNESELYASWIAGWFTKEEKGDELKGILGEDSIWAIGIADSEESRKRALHRYDQLKQEGALGIQQEIWWRHRLVRMGMLPESQDKWMDLANKPHPDVFMLDYPLRLFSGKITPDLLKKEAENTDSRRWMAAAHFYIACYYFRQKPSEELREAAKAELSECLKHDVFMDNIGFYAQHMLDQLRNDSKYPWVNVYSSTDPSDK